MAWGLPKRAAPAAKRVRIEKCSKCKKSGFKCACNQRTDGVAEKAKVKVTDSRGRTRTVTKNTGNTIAGGHTWCGKCGCRVMSGTCSNITCSSRKS